ncbi:hypothetical protein SDC9_07792 [bioreactor metagenome]|uniref:Uncharacterized protein n=1 Tax=bioreactor metagenome TaxID=1076179 RepID=A0A644T5I2_9ZZZZ|nr:hypothetical protein [Candidatus Elulimicrobiales bacterium]
MENKKIKWYWWVVIVLVVLFIIYKAGVFNKYLSSPNTDNKNASQLEEVKADNLIVSGTGNEPGWSFQIKGDNADAPLAMINLSLDYGSTTWYGLVGKTWQEDYSNEFQYRGDVSLLNADGSISSTTKNIIIFFEKKECMDDAGRANNLAVSLDFHSEKEYKGCANLAN